MHDAVKEGDTLLISEPRNHFPLVHAQRSAAVRGRHRRDAAAVHGAAAGRHRRRLHAALLHALGGPHGFPRRDRRLAVRGPRAVPLRRRPASQKLDLDRVLAQPEPARISTSAAHRLHRLGGEDRRGLGWPQEQVHLEYFGAAPQDTAATGLPGEDRQQRRGLRSRRRPDRGAGAAGHGVEILTSCEQGVCGTCITRVLQGECDHRDLYFTDEEKAKHDQFTPCCSRAKSAVLVLDL
jgi:vanillate O-demethylase ferredoxin subunit